jgi:8-oxo-dGTP diphosphatase
MARDVVAIVLHNPKGKLLLQKRTNDAPTNPSKWGFFGGGIDKGESELDAINRETFEELEYRLKNPLRIYEGTHPGNGKIYAYIEKYDSSQKLQLHEGETMGWFSIDEINKLDIVPYMLKILQEIKRKLF